MKSIAFKLSSYTLIIALMIFFFRSAIPFIEFEINKKYIQENLCESKNIAENTCKGECHLKKQIDRSQKEEKEQKPVITKHQILLFLVSEPEKPLSNLRENFFFGISHKDLYSFLYITKLLKPPIFIFYK